MRTGAPFAAPERVGSHPVLDPAQDPVGLSKGPAPVEQRSASDDSSGSHFDGAHTAATASPAWRAGPGGYAGAAAPGESQSKDHNAGGRPLRSANLAMVRPSWVDSESCED